MNQTYEKRQDTLIDLIIEEMEGYNDSHGRRFAMREELAEKLSGLPVVIERVVNNMIAADRDGSLYGENGGWWWGSYVKDRPSDYNLARVKLAEHFGAARDFDLDEQAKANLEGAKKLKEELDKEHKKLWDLQRDYDQQATRISHLQAGLKDLILAAEYVARSGKIDNQGDFLSQLLFRASEGREHQVFAGQTPTHLCHDDGCKREATILVHDEIGTRVCRECAPKYGVPPVEVK